MLSKILRGIAVADAIGNPLEFLREVSKDDFKSSMLLKELRVSDDTQMTLFCAESLSRAGDDLTRVASELEDGYRRWYKTQGRAIPCTDGLLRFGSLYRVEAPGKTCMGSLYTLTSGRKPTNYSKGNGTVMRCAPIAVWAKKYDLPREVAFAVAGEDAKITHLHPYAAQSSMLLTAIYLNLFEGKAFIPSVAEATLELERGGLIDPEVSDLCLYALNATFFDRIKETRGGWIAEEALAIAVGAVARSKDYIEAITDAITIGGDSDTTGGIAGGLAVAAGMHAPDSLVSKVNVMDAIAYADEHFQ